MRRLADAGIEIGGRLAPWFYTEDYDYSLFQDAGCSNVTLEMFRWSILWRHSVNPAIWEILSGGTFPGGSTKKGTVGREWVEAQEKAYFGKLQDLDAHPYNMPGNSWILMDIYKLRELFSAEKEKAQAAGLLWAICAFGSGIHNIDLNDNPCGCLTEGWRYDPGALVPAWHKNQWADYKLPVLQEYELDTAIDRFIVANSDAFCPVALNNDKSLIRYGEASDDDNWNIGSSRALR